MSDGAMYGGGKRLDQRGTLGSYTAKKLLDRKRKKVRLALGPTHLHPMLHGDKSDKVRTS